MHNEYQAGDPHSINLIREDIKLLARTKECYFITITIKPKLYQYSSVTQIELTNNILFDLLYKYTKDFYCVAEHTKAGNIHYHAVLEFDPSVYGQRTLLINALKKTKIIGFFKLDTKSIEECERVANYMTKDLYETYKILHGTRGHKPVVTVNSIGWRFLTGK